MQTVRDTVMRVLSDYAGIDPSEVKVSDTLSDLGIDSLDTLEVGLELEGHYGSAAYFGEYDMAALKTVEDLIVHISSRIQERSRC